MTSKFSHANKELIKSFQPTAPDQCSTKRLDLNGGVMSKIPIQDQGNLRICWSYGASQLIDAWRIKNDPPVEYMTSPTPLALQYAKFKKRTEIFEPESAIRLLQNANELRICSYDKVKDYNNKQSNAEFISELVNSYTQFRSNPDNKVEILKKLKTCLIEAGFKNKSDLEKLSQHLSSDTWVPFVDGILQDICGNDSKKIENVPKPKYKTSNANKNGKYGIREIQNLINSKLDEKNPSPIGITFCHAVLKNRDTSSMELNGEVNNDRCPSAIHTAPIIGRRLVKYMDKNGVEHPFCQFLVRDSYGTSCANYPDDPEITPSKICENGQIWVDESALLTNTADAYYLEDIKK